MERSTYQISCRRRRSAGLRPSRGLWWIWPFVVLGLCVSLAGPACAADRGAVVSGVVRDTQGVAQLGALVQVLAANSHTVATAFTDQHGRYLIANLAAGDYAVRASQTLLVPVTRAHLHLRTGTAAIVDLTLAALFDTTSWLPAERRHGRDADDDWKWTLRSAANRPILRVLAQDETASASADTSESKSLKPVLHGKAMIEGGDGGFAQGGLHTVIALQRTLGDQAGLMLRADLGANGKPWDYGSSQEIAGGYQRKVGLDGAMRTVVTYQAHPELIAASGSNGLTVLAVTSAQRMNLAGLVELELGSEVEAVRSGETVLVTHPFLQVAAHASGAWTLHYRFASDRQLQGFEDVTTASRDVPVALGQDGQFALEQGSHQEASISRRAGRSDLELVYFHDRLQHTLLSGGGTSGLVASNSRNAKSGMVVDPVTGTFQALGTGFADSGLRVTAAAPLTETLWVAAEYSLGRALASSTGNAVNFAGTLSGMKPRRSQAMTLALKAKSVKTQTQMRASYRWQAAQLVSAVDPYSHLSEQAFLSCSLRQPLHGVHAPQGLSATIDVTNLLAEGYRPFVSDDGETLYFAQAPRTMQAGLSFSF